MIQLPARELVVGDVILVEAGDMIPADARLIENAVLRWMKVLLPVKVLRLKRAWTLFWQKHHLAIGQICCFPEALSHMGVAKQVVTDVGMQTEVGKIAGLLKSTSEKQTPLQANWMILGKSFRFDTDILRNSVCNQCISW